MKASIAAAGVFGIATVTLGLLGAGVANADDAVVGQSYKDAKAALSQQGLTPVIATTVGDRKDRDECLVTSATPGSGLDGFGEGKSNIMMVNLNCYATYGTALWPGFSIQSPEGRKMWEADRAAKQKKEAEARAAQEQSEAAALEGNG